jgi:hypothetical protein
VDDLDALDDVDCFDDEDDVCDLEELTPELAFLHEHQRRRGALDAHADRYGLEAVNLIIERGLEQTARLAGVRVAVVPDELARFMQADDAFWVNLMCGLWYNAGDRCGAARRDELGELEEWCMLPPHGFDTPHGFCIVSEVDGRQYIRTPAVTW